MLLGPFLTLPKAGAQLELRIAAHALA